MPKQNDRPIHEVRIGAINAAIWKNDTANGVRCNATLSRIYKDREDNQWKSTDSFGRDDLLALAKSSIPMSLSWPAPHFLRSECNSRPSPSPQTSTAFR